ncbi:MAG: Clp protease N-terminal domain-containing protein [Candidatus Falkowbacteria bacterium]
MLDKFTHKSQEAIINAQIVAQDHGQQHIEALHVLASLIKQNESLIKTILEKMNVNPVFIEKNVFEEIERLPKMATTSNVGTVNGTAEVAMLIDRA